MKRNFLMMAFVSLFTVVALCSCNKDDEENDDNGGNGVIQNNTIIAVVENGASYNSKIDLVIKAIAYSEGNPDDEITLASAPYANGGFTLKLPESVNDKCLYNLKAADDVKDYEGITISNPNVKGCKVFLCAYESGDSEWWNVDHKNSEWIGRLYYVEADLSITGSHIDKYYSTKYSNFHLKKGWNIVYFKYIEKNARESESEYTTQVPSGAKWFFWW
jgi:hypothetical protein